MSNHSMIYHGMSGYSMIHGMEALYRHYKFLGPQSFFFFFSNLKGSFIKFPINEHMQQRTEIYHIKQIKAKT